MKSRKIFCATIALITAASSFSIEVNRSELETTAGRSGIVFQNYSGPHTIINSVEQIRGIGSALGSEVLASDVEKYSTAGTKNRYYVIHAVDPKEKENLDADIFIIGESATVDHIKNLRRILSAYLSAAYKYSRSDADTIATYITVYNAVYRGNKDYFNSKYKKIVTDAIASDKLGISLDYQEWAGKTQLVIPLSDVNGGLSTVDTSVISDHQVVKSLQNEDDKGIATRKSMVDIKEREADNASETAQESQKKTDAENAKLKEEQDKLSQANKEAVQAKNDANKAQKEADEAQKKADEAKKKAAENPNDKAAQAEAAKLQAEADKKQAEADKKKAEADKKQDAANKQSENVNEQAKKADEAKSETEAAQAQADKKRNEAQEERAAIAEDQQALMDKESNESGNVIYGLKSIDEVGVMSEIVKMDAETGSVLKESPVSVIRSRTVYEDGDFFVAIAGTNFGNGAIKLVLIDKENLEIVKESNEVLSETSVLVEFGGFYYCVIRENNTFLISKYNENLESMKKSAVAVKAATPITITSKGVLATAGDGKPVLLNLNDLAVISK